MLKLSGNVTAMIDYFIVGSIIFVNLFYFVVSRLKIILDDEGFEIHYLIRKDRIRWDSIIKSKISFEVEGHSGDVKWIFQTKEEKTYSFSPSFYSRTNIQKIAEILVEKSLQADISNKVKQMAKGKFPWYIF